MSGGALLELGCPSRLDRSTDQQTDFIDTLGGKRKAFLRQGGRRSWSVDVSTARPAEVSGIEAMARFGGPLGWYPPEAVIGNLLSPQASGFDTSQFNATPTGMVQLGDGSAARAVALSGAITIGSSHGSYEAVPVKPSTPVTVGGWGLGGIRFTGVWRDADLVQVGTFSGATFVHSGWAFRSQSFTPPVAAKFLSVTFLGATQVARPTVAWGTTARDELGTGCPFAVFHSPQHSPFALWQGANYTQSSYQVTEVG